MKSNYPDPSLVNSTNFYGNALQIKRLLRRRGLQNVEPMGGKIYSYMPSDLFNNWSKYSKRQELVGEKNGGKEFERYIAQVISQYYCNPATFSNKVLDLSPGGDYDVLAKMPGETLFHFEAKASIKNTKKTISIADIWNFLIRDSVLGSDATIFIVDGNFDLYSIARYFDALYALAEFITHDGELIETRSRDIESFLQKDPNSIIAYHKKITESMYYIFYPVLLVCGGDNIQKNIGEAISFYYKSVSRVSLTPRYNGERTGEIFRNLKNWNILFRGSTKKNLETKIKEVSSWT